MTVLGGRAERVAERLARQLESYARRFAGVTDGARARFEKRRWSEQGSAQRQRAAMRERAVAAAAREVRANHGFERSWALPWNELCGELRREVEGEHLRTWARAFGACVAHRLGVRELILAPVLRACDSVEALRRCIGVLPCRGAPGAAVRELLRSAGLRRCWPAFEDDVAAGAARLGEVSGGGRVELLVHLEPAFRGEHCYLLGLCCREGHRPVAFVPELVHGPAGVRVERVIGDPDSLLDVFDPDGDPVMVATLHPDATAAFLRAVLPGLSAEDSFRVLGLSDVADELLRRCITGRLIDSGTRLEVSPRATEPAAVSLVAPGLDLVVSVAGRRPAGAHELDALVLPRAAFDPVALDVLRRTPGALVDTESDDPVILRRAGCRCVNRRRP